MRAIALSLIVGLSLVGCRTSSGSGLSAEARDLTLVFLRSGPRVAELTPEELQAATTGHRSTIERLAQERVLLLAGPFGEPRSDPDLRGIYVFDLADTAEAEALTAEDPAVQAGALALRAHPWRTDSNLSLVRELEEARKALGEPFGPQAYILAIGSPAGAAWETVDALRRDGRVLLAGELGGDRSDELLFILNASTMEQARAWLLAQPSSSQASWRMSPWYGTEHLNSLAGPPRRAR